MIRRLDHVAIVVRSTEQALEYYRGRLGLEVTATEVLEELQVRLTYLTTGNAYLQLVEPIAANSPIAAHLEAEGEGLHHVCFGCDDPIADAATYGEGEVTPGHGRGRVSVFVPGPLRNGTRLECNEFRRTEDVDQSRHALGV